MSLTLESSVCAIASGTETASVQWLIISRLFDFPAQDTVTLCHLQSSDSVPVTLLAEVISSFTSKRKYKPHLGTF